MSNTPKVRTMSGYSFSYRPASEEEHEDGRLRESVDVADSNIDRDIHRPNDLYSPGRRLFLENVTT